LYEEFKKDPISLMSVLFFESEYLKAYKEEVYKLMFGKHR
jgi:hypothetical protein